MSFIVFYLVTIVFTFEWALLLNKFSWIQFSSINHSMHDAKTRDGRSY